MSPEVQPQGRILVVDDEVAAARLLQQWLQADGHQVECAADFESARALLAQEPFDLATLDIAMPGVDGLEILRWLQRHYPDLGVIMATALGEVEMAIQAMRLGAYGYLLKPFNLELVTEEVRRALERQQLVAQNRAYQRELEQRVAAQTAALQAAQARLERKARELEARNRLLQLQLAPPADEQTAHQAIAEAAALLVDPAGVRLLRPAAAGTYLEAVAGPGTEGPYQVPLASRESPAVLAFSQGRSIAQEGEIVVPVLYRTAPLGVLQVEGKLDPESIAALGRLGQEAALLLRLVQVARDLETHREELGLLLQKQS